MTEVIYARVPDDVKQAADSYAGEQGMTLTGAVVELLGKGLAASSDEDSIAELQANLAGIAAEKAQIEAKLGASAQEAGALKSFVQRASANVGTCPNDSCGKPISGYDLLAAGKCPSCDQKLTEMIVPAAEASTLDSREVLTLLGGLGIVLALAYLTSAGP